MRGYIPRLAAGAVAEALGAFPVVIVTGMRQTGKTTLLTRDPAFRGRRYVSLDDFARFETARSNPEGLLGGKGPLTIDEAQRAPEIFRALKRAVDEDRRPGRFLLSGSANLELAGRSAETLAGRAYTIELGGLTRRERAPGPSRTPRLVEILGGASPGDLEWPGARVSPADVLLGGLPEVAAGHAQPLRWFEGFVGTYVERDLRTYAEVGDLVAFRRLLGLVAHRTGQILNETSLGRDAAVSNPTARRYLGLLETGFVARRLAPYLRNRASRLVKSPKIYLSDSGLAAALAGADDIDAVRNEPLRGALLETFVLQNLLALTAGLSPPARVFFWNVSGRHEVDFVIERGRRRTALEVKWGSRWNDRDLRGLRAWQEKEGKGALALLACACRASAPLGADLWAVPIGDLLA